MDEPERTLALNTEPPRRGSYVLYWMQASQRAECNHALELAIRLANERPEPVAVVFGLWTEYPEANERSFAFMLEGLAETQRALAERGIGLVVLADRPDRAALALSGNASQIVTDCGYLAHQRAWRRAVAAQAPCRVLQVETDVVVPVALASTKEEYAARTIRPRIVRHLEHCLRSPMATQPRRSSLGLERGTIDVSNPRALVGSLRIDRSVPPSSAFRGGASEGRERLARFIRECLDDYPEKRADPNEDCVSHMSPYLHFGQISPIEIATQVAASGSRGAGAYLEELIVRRELSVNYVHYNDLYSSYESLPRWARDALARHAADPRGYCYSAAELEGALTHDPYWNAAQRELVATGKMHNYMRMYWGKKILEWAESPQDAFRIALWLNNRFALDGRDPNSYAGVAWCFGKHDRPWQERPIFGSVRYMNAAGLRRKFDIDRYVRRWS